MSSIDVLRLRINSIDKAIEYAKWQKSMFPQDREELCEQISGLRSERKATIKAIAALEKVEKIKVNLVLVDKGALKMALNVLDRAGKKEVSQALRESCIDFID